MFTRKSWSMVLLAATLIVGCSKESETAAPAPTFEWTTEIPAEGPSFVVPDTKFELTYTAAHVASVEVGGLAEGWSAQVDPAAGRIEVSATADAATQTTLKITATGENGERLSPSVALYCLNAFDDPKGVFVLNEGNMTTENGSLTWISPEGYVVDDAYKAVNGTELGNVAQDMDFCGGRIYIISQNGDTNPNGTTFENDGMLVVVDARTLKRTASFTKEQLPGLDWPTHVAVLDEQHIYIRDNACIHRFDATTGTLTTVESSDGAPKSRFVKMNDKVYTYKSGAFCYIYELSTASDDVTRYRLPFSGMECPINELLGIQGADDGRMWVMSFGFGKTAINKFDLSTLKVIQRQIGVQPAAGSSGVTFVARGNDLYYADGVTLYHLPFDESGDLTADSGLTAEQSLVDLSTLDKSAAQLYNGLGIHPVTGCLYANTIKSFPLYAQNTIWCFDLAAGTEAPAARYDNYTNFPAGFYFPTGRE